MKSKKKKKTGFFSKLKKSLRRLLRFDRKKKRKKDRDERQSMRYERSKAIEMPQEKAFIKDNFNADLPALKRLETRPKETRQETRQETRRTAIIERGNINTMISMPNKGTQILSFDTAEGKKSFPMQKEMFLQLSNNVQFIYSDGIATIQTNQGRVIKQTEAPFGKTTLIVSSLVA